MNIAAYVFTHAVNFCVGQGPVCAGLAAEIAMKLTYTHLKFWEPGFSGYEGLEHSTIKPKSIASSSLGCNRKFGGALPLHVV